MNWLALALWFLLGAPFHHAQAYLYPLGVQGSNGAFSPATATGLSLWFDPSDSTTVFTDTGCSTPAVATNSVGCIKDKSGNGCNAIFTTTMPVLTNSGGTWFLDTTSVQNSGIFSCTPINLEKNIGYVSMHTAVHVSSDVAQTISMISTGTNATAARTGCANDASTTGEGFSVFGRRLDADSFQDVGIGTFSSAISVVRCQISYALGTAAVFVNNVSAASSGSFQTSGNTDNTASLSANILGPSGGALFIGHFYGLVMVTPSSGFTQEAAIDTWLCTKAGITC